MMFGIVSLTADSYSLVINEDFKAVFIIAITREE